MHLSLEKLLHRRGIKDIKELSQEEQGTFDRWNTILVGEITVEKIREFCAQQRAKIIDEELGNFTNSERKDNFIKAIIHVYSKLIKLIDSPEVERKSLEKYLEQLTK